MSYDLDYSALKSIQTNATSGSNASYTPEHKIVFSSTLSLEENEFTILPPHPHAKGIWFQKLCIWKIDGKNYVTNLSFTNGKDPLWEIRMNALKQAEKTGDSELIKKINNWRMFSRTFEYSCPALIFSFPAECINGEGIPVDELGNPVVGDGFKKFLLNDKACILQLNQAMFNAANSHITKRQYLGKLIRDDGYNFIGGKNQAGDYECTVSPNITQKPLEFYKDLKNIPDVWTIAKKRCYSDTFMEKLMNWYLFGTEKPEKDLWRENNVEQNFVKKEEVKEPETVTTTIAEVKEEPTKVNVPISGTQNVSATKQATDKALAPKRNVLDLLNDDENDPF